jgi:hypothetical protein
MMSQRSRTSSTHWTHHKAGPFLRTLLLAPLLIGVGAALVAVSSRRAERRRRMLRELGRAPRRQSLPQLRDAILGAAKREIASVLGPPQSASVGRPTADTWYYPLRPGERLAMAISFDRGLARDVEFFTSPGR